MNSFGWLRLIETCQSEIEDKISRDDEYEDNLKTKCTKILVHMNLNFTDIREWQYFFLSLYTKIINDKHQIQQSFQEKSTYEEAHNLNRIFRRKLITNLRNLELCFQDIFSDIKFNSKFMFNYNMFKKETSYEQFKAAHELNDEDAKISKNNTKTPVKYSYNYKEIYSFKSKKSSALIDSSATKIIVSKNTMRTEDLYKVNIERKKLDFDSAVLLEDINAAIGKARSVELLKNDDNNDRSVSEISVIMDEDCSNINEDENYGENIKAYSCVVKSIQSYVNEDNNNNLDLSTNNNITTNNGRNDADQNFNTPSNIIVDNTSIITDNNNNTIITDNNNSNTIANENSSTRVSKRLKNVKNNYNETNALISNNFKKQKTFEFKTIINQLDHYATTSKKYNIKTFEVRNHKNLKKIEALKNKYIICNSTIKKLKNDNRLIKKDFKKKVKELSKICDDLREELQQTKQKLNDLDKNISVNNRLNFDECSNVDQVVDNIKEYESSNSSDEEYSFSNNNTISKTDESLKETESIINTLTQKQRNGQEGWKKTFKKLSELTRKYNILIKEESSDDDLL